MAYEFDLLYYIGLFKRSKMTIILVVAVSMFLTMLFSLCTRTTYISTATLLLGGGEGAAASSLGKLFGISGGGGASSSDIIVSILKSRRMVRDINEQFKVNENPKLWWSINTRDITAGMAIDARGPDPALTERIANFCVQDLDKINNELEITAQKPMAKVLDPATYGSPESKKIPQKMTLAGMLAFLAASMYMFLADYLDKLKAASRR